MSVQSDLRSVMPTTTRNFEHRIAEVQQRVDETSDRTFARLDEVQRSVETIVDRVQPQLIAHEQRLADLQARFDKPGYCNLEYLSLDRSYAGRKILLCGWYGASNCGDEMMMKSVLQHFDGLDARVYVLLWDDFDYDFGRLPFNAFAVHYPRSLWDIRQLADFFDAVVWGGGAIIDEHQFSAEPTNINTGNLLVRLSEEMLKRGKDVFALGLSANDSLEPGTEFVRRLGRVVEGSRHFSLRDEYSRDVLESAGIAVENVSLCEDLVFGNRQIGRPQEVDSPDHVFTVGAVLMTGDVTREHNRLVLPRMLSLLGERFGDRFKLRLIPFYNYWGFDSNLLRELVDDLGVSDKVEIVQYTDSLSEMPIYDCDAVVAYRYHACVVAASSDIPTLFVCVDRHPHYRNKMRHVAELFRSSDNFLLCSTCLDDGTFDERFTRMFDEPLRPTVPEGIFASMSSYLDQICQMIVKE